MPIYEYRCAACGAEIERRVPRGTAAPACPSCATFMTKKVSVTSFILQGSGWYKDHYGLKSSEQKAGDGKSAEVPAAKEAAPAKEAPAAAKEATPAPAAPSPAAPSPVAAKSTAPTSGTSA